MNESRWKNDIRRSDKYDGVLEDRILCISVVNLYLMCHFTGSE